MSSTAALLIALIILLASLDQKNNLGLITKTKKQWYIARAGGIALALLSFVVFHLESLLPVLDTGEMAVVYVFGAYVFTLLDSIIGLPLFIYEGVMQSRRSGPAASELQQRAREIERELRSE
ncbi:hypothetical protein [Halogeometricum borinquense]|uniref:hypothetical protein n=1 Tax=Halogeometricum borinquense TaxID=60847 RepID=UPI003447495E